jgi:hypothetical protein
MKNNRRARVTAISMVGNANKHDEKGCVKDTNDRIVIADRNPKVKIIEKGIRRKSKI